MIKFTIKYFGNCCSKQNRSNEYQTFNGNNLPHELLLTPRQKTNLRNAFENNMSTDLKLSKAQISKIIQPGEILRSSLSKLARPIIKISSSFGKKYFSSFRN